MVKVKILFQNDDELLNGWLSSNNPQFSGVSPSDLLTLINQSSNLFTIPGEIRGPLASKNAQVALLLHEGLHPLLDNTQAAQ